MDNLIDEFREKFNKYEIISQTGRLTWQIRLTESGTLAVLKQIENPSVYKNLQTLSIKGIPMVYDVFEKDGKSYVIEEYISGKTLAEKISADGKFSKGEVRRIICELCLILMPLHANDIIHRDIKPSNVMMTHSGKVYLIDFDIARKHSDNSTDTTHLGTQYYASPEQYGFAQTDSRSDIYSVGRLMIVLLSGKEKEAEEGTPFKHIIQRCVRVDAEKRYKNVKELYFAIKVNPMIKNASATAAVLVLTFGVLILAVSKNKTVVADNNDVIEAKNDEDVTEEIPEEDEVETEDVESEEAETESEAITEEGDISEEEESVAEDGTQPQNRSSSSVEKNDGTEKTQVQATEKQTEKATQPTTKAATQSKESNDAPSGDYEEDTIWFGADKSSGYNCYGNIYVEGSADATPIMDVDNLYPKQVNSIEIKSGVSERIYAENTSQGLKIITSGGSLIVPASGNREHYPYESLSPNVHSYTMVFKDFNHDGVKEIFVSDLACCSSGDKKLIALFMTGSFVTFNGNMKPVLCSGDELFMMCGADIMTIKDNSVLTQNTYGTQYVSYKLDGNTVVKFEGSE